ncbi:MAG TPA: type II toxin-antitoxin system prevent-host-death family antitoxin [Geminicoccaceae bacterium]|nr:type II toxin-antitoxin system prevent-host-death family antitoxin [Geminicoccaceae bacterium]
MPDVTAYEAKTHFSRLLQRAANGERITITRHGVPVAELGPTAAARQREIEAAVERIRELRKGSRLGPEVTIADLLKERRG